jgi:hypothetical protein
VLTGSELIQVLCNHAESMQAAIAEELSWPNHNEEMTAAHSLKIFPPSERRWDIRLAAPCGRAIFPLDSFVLYYLVYSHVRLAAIGAM